MSSKGVKKMKQVFPSMCMLTMVKTDLTYHHMHKKADGGELTIENGSILNLYIHAWLHNIVEKEYPELWELIHEMLRSYKKALLEGDKESIAIHININVPYIHNLYNTTTYGLKGFVREDEINSYKRIRRKIYEEEK